MWNKWFGKKQTVAHPSPGDAGYEGQLNVVVLTDLGMVRTNNEDMGLFYRTDDEDIVRKKGYMLVVADGMGGHQAGEVASRMAAETVCQSYFHSNGNTGIEKSLERAFNNANEKIYQLSSSDAACRGMGTTCTVVVLNGSEIYYAHAGDSRAYQFRNGTGTRITTDHTYVQELVASGEITDAEAAKHPKRNILTNAMGTKPSLRTDTGKHSMAFEPDDRILVCSDGLYDYLADDELAAILQGRSLQEAAEYMVSEAKQRGGHDNITVVLAEKINRVNTVAGHATRDVEVPQTKETELP